MHQPEDSQPDGDDNGAAPGTQDPLAPEEDPVQPEDSGEETYEAYDPDTDMLVDEGEDEAGGQVTDQGEGGDLPEEETQYPIGSDGYGQGDDGQFLYQEQSSKVPEDETRYFVSY
jgi:hypothetical protein